MLLDRPRRFIVDTSDRIRRAARWLLGPLLAGCSVAPPRPPEAPPARSSGPAPVVTAPSPAPVEEARPGSAGLPPPRPVRSLAELRRQAAERMVAANPDGTYMSKPPPLLLAIPVLEVELRADGSVKRIQVLRKPTQATDTVQLAIDAVQRAAPYGDLRRMPEPWKFTETFLFDDQRRFKPRTLD
jgi:hypothetical protein